MVRRLRKIADSAGYREICVNADPLKSETDNFPTHASILLASRFINEADRIDWTLLRLKLADAFAEVLHFSGKDVAM